LAIVSQLAAISSLVFSTTFVILFHVRHSFLFADPVPDRVCNSFPRCFEGLDPDRFVGGRGLTGDDHIPIIDCMKICCGEGKKGEGKERMLFGLQLSQRDSVPRIRIR
jgi:hypothetical protein